MNRALQQPANRTSKSPLLTVPQTGALFSPSRSVPLWPVLLKCFEIGALHVTFSPSTVAAWPFNCLCQHNEDIVGISLSLVKDNIYYFTPNPVATWSSRSAEDNQKTRWFCGRSSALRFNPGGLKSCHRYLICHRVAPAHSDYIMTDQPIQW